LILNLQVTGSNHKTGKNLLALGPLELLKLSQIGPWFSPNWTRRRRAHRRRGGTGRQTSGREVQLGSPAIDWWRRFGRGGRRRAAATAQRRRGRRGSDGDEERGGAQQCGLGKVLGRSLGLEDRRRGELGNGGLAAAAEARAPVKCRHC
jgi:hypothetical protein